MTRRTVHVLALLATALLAPSVPGSPRSRPQEAAAPARETASLEALLEPLRARFELPALGAAVVRGGDLVALGAVGRRRADDTTPVTVEDRWHLGSCTKSMTATWIALHVERGELSWERTVGESFPELFDAGRADPGWRGATLEQLLQNRAGAPAELDADGLWGRLWAHGGTPAEQRRTLVEGVLARPPLFPPGTRYQYSNAGFAIAAAMAERALGTSWEEAIAAELFRPLGIESFGFGAPGTPGEVAQPFGHTLQGEALVPQEPGPAADNPSAIAPAGKLHMGLGDWARYAALHLAGANGAEDLLLPPEAFARLHEPALEAGGSYAMGWLVGEPAWAGELVLWHNGSNTLWYAEIALLPGSDLGLLVAANRGDGRVREAVGETVRALHRWAREDGG